MALEPGEKILVGLHALLERGLTSVSRVDISLFLQEPRKRQEGQREQVLPSERQYIVQPSVSSNILHANPRTATI